MPKLELELVPADESVRTLCVVCDRGGAEWKLPALPGKGIHTHCKVSAEKSPKRSPSGTMLAVKP